jgi:cysteine-rich repeat protein
MIGNPPRALPRHPGNRRPRRSARSHGLVIALVGMSMLGIGSRTAAAACLVEFHLTEPYRLGSLDFTVDYASAAGRFAIAPGTANPDCRVRVSGALGEFADDRPGRRLDLAMVSFAGFSGPRPVAECSFVPAGAIAAGEFVVTVDQAATPDGEGLEPLPTVTPRLRGCDPDSTTTTSVTTTTAFVTTSTLYPFLCDLEVSLLGEAGVAALQWELGYDPTLGSFPGTAMEVDCDVLLSKAITAFNDSEVEARIDVAHIALDEFRGPTELLSCRWQGSLAPSGTDFPITVTVAQDKGDEPVLPRPTVALTALECRSSVTTTTLPACGDGVVQGDEECDDGNTADDDACLDGCVAARCGDAVLRLDAEECDDGNTADGDGCSAGCAEDLLCGDADRSGRILATDALLILKRAVGIDLPCPTWLCDVDGNGRIAASDALAALVLAVFNRTATTCPRPTAVLLELAASEPLEHLEIEWYDTGGAGDFAGLPSAPDCVLLAAGSMTAGPLIDGVELEIDFAEPPAEGATLVRCAFVARDTVADGDFAVDVLEALAPGGTALGSDPTFVVQPD